MRVFSHSTKQKWISSLLLKSKNVKTNQMQSLLTKLSQDLGSSSVSPTTVCLPEGALSSQGAKLDLCHSWSSAC